MGSLQKYCRVIKVMILKQKKEESERETEVHEMDTELDKELEKT